MCSRMGWLAYNKTINLMAHIIIINVQLLRMRIATEEIVSEREREGELQLSNTVKLNEYWSIRWGIESNQIETWWKDDQINTIEYDAICCQHCGHNDRNDDDLAKIKSLGLLQMVYLLSLISLAVAVAVVIGVIHGN